MPQIGRIFALLGVEHLAEAALGGGGVLRLTPRRLPHLGQRTHKLHAHLHHDALAALQLLYQRVARGRRQVPLGHLQRWEADHLRGRRPRVVEHGLFPPVVLHYAEAP